MDLLRRPLHTFLTRATSSVPVAADEEYKITGIYSFGKGLIKRDVIQGSETAYKFLSPISTGQLVMSKLNAWEGALAVVPHEFNGTFVSPEYPVFDIDPEVAEPSYVKHLICWQTFWEMLTPRGSMVRRKRTTPETLLGTVAPLPDIDEQRRIASRLDATLSRADGVQALREKMATLRENLGASFITSAIESATESVRMGDVVVFERTPIEIDPDSDYRNIGIRSFGKGFIRHPPVTGSNLSKLSYFTFSENALALSNLMAWEGGISVTRSEDTGYIASNRFFFYLPADDRVNTSYMRHFLLSRQGQSLIASACSAGAERNRTLGRKRFEDLVFRLPPRPVQDRVARTLDALTERLDAAHSEPALDALRPSILNAAFTGQL
ncbi:hypothetical protein [Streptomyces olivaceus]|uniref:hypothetical protein n=1 Tax=Streptomyces olivaceus TaxID=47716 RepID=UPI001CCE1696|nr:hypothetical protein [Streptomyces olivaceus]MBZ6132239.1 hypothetical protein [Streptomyces olivaceus]